MLGWMKHKLESRLTREISLTSDTQMAPPLWQKVKELLDESERGDWKSWLKTQHSKNEDHSIQSHHFMGNRWGNNGNSHRIFLGSKITADSDWSHKIKRCLFLGRKAMTNLDSILKSRNITLPMKVHLSQSYGFSGSHVWIGELNYKESWALKLKRDTFELCC